MSSSNRSSQFTKLHKALKKHYRPVPANTERSVIEHLLFGCLLEDAQYDLVEEIFAAITEEYFDWNEVRVSSVRELSETMARLPDPPAAAGRMKSVLQHVFEANYAFDLEGLRKKNLGPASEAMAKIKGTNNFTVSYAIQSALGGHSIPLDSSTLEIMRILGLATEKEVESRTISGLERAIPKSKGIEFGSLLHQMGAEFAANPFSADLRAKLLEIEPEAKNRWPKRRTGKSAAKQEAEEEAKPADEKVKGKKKKTTASDKPSAAKSKKAATSAKTPGTKKKVAKKTPTTKRKKVSSTSKKKTTKRLSKRKPR